MHVIDGVILVECGEQSVEDIQLKYQHLNPSSHFRPVIEQARSVILAGGTMSPVRYSILSCVQLAEGVIHL